MHSTTSFVIALLPALAIAQNGPSSVPSSIPSSIPSNTLPAFTGSPVVITGTLTAILPSPTVSGLSIPTGTALPTALPTVSTSASTAVSSTVPTTVSTRPPTASATPLGSAATTHSISASIALVLVAVTAWNLA